MGMALMGKTDYNDKKEMSNPFNRLPDECIVHIFSYNPDPTDRWLSAAVCKKWLLLQAHMKRSDFNTVPPSKPSHLRRCLEGGDAVDTRLAAMAVRKWARGIVGDLSIRGDFLEEVRGSGGDNHHRKRRSMATVPPRFPRGVTDCGLDIVGSGFPFLKSLSLWGCLYITNKGLVCVSMGCSLLEKLDLCECPLITDEGMVAVAKGLKKLTTLRLESCHNIGNSTLKAFGKHTLSLHSISVKECRLVGDEGVLAILAGLPNLKRLKLAQLRSNLQPVLALVKHCKALTSLSLEGYKTADRHHHDSGSVDQDDRSARSITASFRYLPWFGGLGREYCANLKNVAISGCTALSGEDLLELGQGTAGLEKLTLEACHGVSFHGLLGFLSKYATSLKNLNLVRCNGIVQPQNWVHSTLISPPSCDKLETLTVSMCLGLRDAFFEWIGRSSGNVHDLELIGLERLTDAGITGLLMDAGSKTRSLDRLVVNGCTQLTDSSTVSIVRSCGAELRSLGISDCVGLTSLSLQAIAFYCTELRDLDVSGCAIRDSDLLHLDQLVWLTSLNLKNCHWLTKEAVESFEESHFECDLVY